MRRLNIRRRRRSVLDRPDRKYPITADAVWYALLALVSLLVLLGGVISAAAVSPTFCGTCHPGASGAMVESAHDGTRCDACHLPGGPLGLVEQRLRTVSMVLYAPVALVTGSGPGLSSTDNAGCLGCHESDISATDTAGGIRMSHRAPQEEGWLCARCHVGTAHPGEEYTGSSYSMDMCLSCHNANPENTTTCDICHPADEKPDTAYTTAWSVTHGAKWRTSHGMGDLTTCKSCHSSGYCAACHNMDLPHAGNFMAQHGADVLSRPNGEADCVVCHQGSACDNCHGIEMPHPGTFTEDHVTLVEDEGQAVCERCHDPSACEACHTNHVHPGIPEDLLKQLQERPVEQ